MDVNDLNKNYLDELLNKISKEEKTFLGDFNINLVNYKNNRPTNDFLASLTSGSLLSCVLPPTRLNCHSKTLIDNIFGNLRPQETISDNITDYLTQFLIARNLFANLSSSDSKLSEKTGQTLIKKITFVITFLLIEKPF